MHPPTAPDSAIARAATDLLVAASPPSLVNHCLRTYAFGLAFVEVGGRPEPDRELFYLASALHDLGLTERFDGDGPFEQEGADAAQAFLRAEGYPDERADLVAEVIRVHLELTTAHDPRPEVALVHIGAGMDVTGGRLDRLDGPTRDRIVEAYPRLGFKRAISDLMAGQAARKPTSLAGQFVSLGALDLIAAAPFEE